MMPKLKLIFFFLFSFISLESLHAQKTKVYGAVTDEETGEGLPFVRVYFYDSKIGTTSDSTGKYVLESYYATDSIVFTFLGYKNKVVKIKKDVSQELNCQLSFEVVETEGVVIRPPDEFPSTKLHKKLIANKDVNNKEKLDAYQYELYNKLQFDINNLGDKFQDRGYVKKLDLILEYLDSKESGETYLPLLLSETISDFFYKNNPKNKKEVITATKFTGFKDLKLDQFTGEMYLDINVYDNYINIFNKGFVSPAANFARMFYRFYLEDSTYIDNRWCYQLKFGPKRSGDLTFEGKMWINDTTYAIKSIKGNISEGANINFVNNLYFEQDFDLVGPEVWMLISEKLIVDLKYVAQSKTLGMFARKHSSRKYFIINQEHPNDFYKSDNTVEVHPEAKTRSEEYWEEHRHFPLSKQEKGIDEMVDSLYKLPAFKFYKNVIYTATTGYYPFKNVELGNLNNAFSVNPVEKYRFGVALRTTNQFSKKIEIGGRLAYGTGDERFKYAFLTRMNLSAKKRALLSVFYSNDIEQIGLAPNVASVGSTFGALFRTGPLDKLTFVEKVGYNLEKDIKKDFVFFTGFEWKEYTALGLANYERIQPITSTIENLNVLTTSEFTARIRWAKNEEFVASVFDRKSITSKYPAISLQCVFGIKGLLGADYSYQKIDLLISHNNNVGVFGRIKYGVYGGYIFGSAAYPFLKVHEGSQTYWFQSNSFNRMNFFEFISDKYVGAYAEHHFGGLILDRVPVVKSFKWRLVASGRSVYGTISDKNIAEMILPASTKSFGNIPYTEASVGIENIFKMLRVDVVWRLSHLDENTAPLGIRGKLVFIF
jgi:hypothetical protein